MEFMLIHKELCNSIPYIARNLFILFLRFLSNQKKKASKCHIKDHPLYRRGVIHSGHYLDFLPKTSRALKPFKFEVKILYVLFPETFVPYEEINPRSIPRSRILLVFLVNYIRRPYSYPIFPDYHYWIDGKFICWVRQCHKVQSSNNVWRCGRHHHFYNDL